MKIEKWAHKPVAGFAGPHEGALDVEAVMLTKDNLEEVAKWCGGEVIMSGVSVPVQVVVGDPNASVLVKRKGTQRDIRFETGAHDVAIGEYVVKYNDRFYVVLKTLFELAYDKKA